MSFDVGASAYDRYMGHWSRLLSPQFVEFAGVRAGNLALDVGCGPGSLAAELAARLGSSAVRAVDPSVPFVAAARSRHGIDVAVAAAEALPFDDRVFDATLAQLVVHFMRDPVRGVAEMGRVTRHGGVVSACVWDFADARGPLGPFWEVARELDSAVEDESALAGTGRGDLVRIFEAAGIGQVEETILSVARDYDSFDDWWEPFTLGVGPGGAYVASLAPDHRAELRQRSASRLPRGPFTIEAAAWAVRGRSRAAASRARPAPR